MRAIRASRRQAWRSCCASTTSTPCMSAGWRWITACAPPRSTLGASASKSSCTETRRGPSRPRPETRSVPSRSSATPASPSRGDRLDQLLEGDGPFERAVNRAFRGNQRQAGALLVAARVGKPQGQLEVGRRPALCLLVLALDLDQADLPSLALGIHLHRDRRARGETGSQELLGSGPLILAPEG